MTSDKKIKPNILFLLIDSLRSDKCYGTERTCLTPNLEYSDFYNLFQVSRI